MRKIRPTLILLGLAGMLPLQGCLPLLTSLPFIGQSNERFILGHLGSKTKVKLKTIGFSAANDANSNFPTRVHLVLIDDPHMIAEMLKMPAQVYFKNYKQLQRDHLSTLHVYSYEVPPGKKLGPLKIDYNDSPVAAFVFASYRTPGDHRIRLTEIKHAYIMLEKNDWHVVPNVDPDA